MLHRRSVNGVLAAFGMAAAKAARAESAEPQPHAFILHQNGWMPNNPRLPVLLYSNVINPSGGDAARAFETVFSANGWPPQRRNGVFSYQHYHSTAHEVLGFPRGKAMLMLGGENGRAVTVRAGDVLVLPAGIGHCEIDGSDDFLVVGAYPPDQRRDICSLAPVPEARERMAHLPFPDSDPVFGPGGPLTRLWARA